MIGYADLDCLRHLAHGANYGPVWVPTRVDAGWAPYRYGHWTWVDPWGWTWIDDAPWGFAPFHYGRWAYVDNRYWGWVPGSAQRAPVYAPALVAFVGGDNFRLSVSSGPTAGVAWFPLAPGEVYRPAYTASRDYFTRVNVTNTVVNVTNVTNVYNNPTHVTDVRYVNINNVERRHRRPYAGLRAGTTRAARGRAHGSRRTAERRRSSPRRRSRRRRQASSAPRLPAQARPAERVMDRPVVAKAAPPAPPPSIEHRQEALKQQPGKPLDRAEIGKAAPPTQVSRTCA